MTRSILKIAGVSLLALLILGASKTARADVHVSAGFGVSGHVVITPPGPPVIIAPMPPLPPPPPLIMPPGPAVIVAPAPPPVIIVEPPAPQLPPPQLMPPKPVRPPFRPQAGLGLSIVGAFHGNEQMHDKGMAGASLLLRIRFANHFATELALNAMGGKGYDGTKRVEVPFSVGWMWMPVYYKSAFQFYTILGFGGAYARVGEEPYYDKPFYLGGFLGLGFEIKMGARRNFALFTDIRGFIRKRVNDRPDDPMIPDGGSCKGSGSTKQCTDWEGGGVVQIGLVTYF